MKTAVILLRRCSVSQSRKGSIMRKLGKFAAACAAVVGCAFSAFGVVYYAAPEGAGDGLSWSSPASAATAIGKAANGDEVWFEKGTYAIGSLIATDKAITLRGGFEGTESQVSERGTDTWSTLDGGTSRAILKFTSDQVGQAVTLDRMELTRASTHALEKTGAANLTLVDCKLTDNGYSTGVQGRGILMNGSVASTVLTIENCEFDRNAAHSSSANVDETGGAGYIQNCAHVYIRNSYFHHNGALSSLAVNQKLPGRDKTLGYTLSFNNAPVTAFGCRFVGNVSCSQGASKSGTVTLVGACGGSSFTNCAWVANCAPTWMANDLVRSNRGTVGIGLDSPSARVDFSNCTFAYNIFDGKTCVGGICASSGAVYVRSSIFYGNMVSRVGTSTDRPCDISVESNDALVDVDYTTFGLEGIHAAACVDGVNETQLKLGSSVTSGDPLFATDWATVTGMLGTGVSCDRTTGLLTSSSGKISCFKTDADLTSIDIRVGEMSVTIDTGDPAAPFANEPEPNGGRVNQGFYGNTPDTPVTTLVMPAFDSVEALETNYTYRLFKVVMGGDKDYSAEVKVFYGPTDARETGDWETEVVLSSAAHPGDVFSRRTNYPYPKGTVLYWKVVATTTAGSVEESGSVVLTGDQPPNVDKGGGADVIHVWSEAFGKSDGSDWLNAVRTLHEAIALVNGSRTNIWIAGTVQSGGTGTLTVPASVKGGFTAMESAADERPADGSLSTVDCGEVTDGCAILSAASGVFSFERVRLMRSHQNCLKLSGGASLEIVDSEIFDNGYLDKDPGMTIMGRGLNLSGNSSKSVVTLRNVRFAANTPHYTGDPTGSPSLSEDGCAIWANGFKQISMEGCSFLTNGLAAWQTGKGANGRSTTLGWVIDAQNAPIVARRCEFRGNRYMTHSKSSMIRLGSGCGGSVFENCVFAGNCGVRWNTDDVKDCVAGCVNCAVGTDNSLAVKNCTFAYNLCDNGRTACICVNSGNVRVENSIFHANLVKDMERDYGMGADLWLMAVGAAANVSYSLFADLAQPYLGTVAGCEAALTLGAGNRAVMTPEFATDIAGVTNLVKTTAIDYPWTTAPFEWKPGVDPTAFDVHLKSQGGRWTSAGYVEDAVTSEAVDNGDPAVACDLEPAPNGGRLNMGAYGNTAEASKSLQVTPEIASVAVDQGTYTHARFAVTLTEKPQPRAKITLLYGLNRPSGDESWEHEEVLAQSTNPGGVYVGEEKFLYPVGVTVYWRIVVASGDLSDVREGTFVTSGEMPASFGKGGGANVVHVRAAAESVGTGVDWCSGFATLAEALAEVTPERNTIWICGDSDFDGVAFDYPVCIIGGFTGTESSEAERPKGARSVLDCHTSADGFVFTHAEGTVRLDGVEVRRAKRHGVLKEGAGSIELVDCRFYDNGYNGYIIDQGSDQRGRGVRLEGVAGISTALVERCVFERNEAKNAQAANLDNNANTDNESGAGAFVKDFALLTIRDSAFLENGIMKGQVYSAMPGRDGTDGWALQVESAPCILTGTRFVGNRACNNGRGNVATLKDASVWMTNCLWAANGSCIWKAGTPGIGVANCATLLLSPGSGRTSEVVNCTFAYNANSNGDCAGLKVASGTAIVRDSILWGNFIRKELLSQSVGADLYVMSGATAFCDHCLLAGDAAPYACSAGTLTLTNRVEGDPLFVTTASEATDALAAVSGALELPGVGGSFYFRSDVDFSAFNLHVRGSAGYTDERTGKRVRFEGVQSPAIDAGTPRDRRRFLEPSGARKGLNLGYYGGTLYATLTQSGMVIFLK